MQEHNVTAVILAAGKGTRMKSSKAKVLHEVFFKPMLHHVLDAVSLVMVKEIVVVTGHQYHQVENSCQDYDVTFARQVEQLGTGHAVLAAESKISSDTEIIMILCGDTPLIRSESLHRMIDQHMQSPDSLTVMTTVLDDPTNYGRIVTSKTGLVEAIVEEKDATDMERKISEVNAGIYCVGKDFLFSALRNVGTDNKQGEVYLTDIVSIAHNAGMQIHKFVCDEPAETLGVNSRFELSRAHISLQERVLGKHMAEGVSFPLPSTTTIGGNVSIGFDTVIEPNVFISGTTLIGKNCHIYPFCYIENCQIGDNVIINAGVVVRDAVIADNEILN